MTRTIDYSPLFVDITPEQVKAYRDSAPGGRGFLNLQPAQLLTLLVAIPVGLLAIGIVASAFATVGSNGGGFFLPGFFFVVVIIALATLAIRSIVVGGARWKRWARLDAFARSNGLVFSPGGGAQSYPGVIFSEGSNRVVLERLSGTEPRYLDLASYRYTTGSGKNRTTHDWGYLALKLDRRLPHMLLDSRANNGLFGVTNLPATFDRDQVLKLEGDFNEHFTLYCPAQYERDALYVFTPDLMALLIDEASPFDVEIVDDWMFVYSSDPLELTDAATIQRLFRIVDTVGTKTLSQTDRYADERIGDPGVNLVAPSGSRLKRGIPVLSVVIFGVVAAVWLWGFLADFTP